MENHIRKGDLNMELRKFLETLVDKAFMNYWYRNQINPYRDPCDSFIAGKEKRTGRLYFLIDKENYHYCISGMYLDSYFCKDDIGYGFYPTKKHYNLNSLDYENREVHVLEFYMERRVEEDRSIEKVRETNFYIKFKAEEFYDTNNDKNYVKIYKPEIIEKEPNNYDDENKIFESANYDN